MNRTTKSAATKPEAVQHNVSAQECAQLLGAIAKQYDAARAAIYLLSQETTDLASKAAVASGQNRTDATPHISDLLAIMNEVTATLTTALIPVGNAKKAMERMSVTYDSEQRPELDSHHRVSVTCASAARALNSALRTQVGV